MATGLGALLPVLAASWPDSAGSTGCCAARADYAARVEPHRSALWWSADQRGACCCWRPGRRWYASLRRIRNTPGWPFLVGAGVAVLFSIVAGLARGGAEAAWLPFFPWLTVAAVAPDAPGRAGRRRTPLLLVAVGALTAIVIEAVLATPW